MKLRSRKTQDPAIRVVIADDQPEVRRHVRHVLSKDGRFEVVGDAEDGEQVVEIVQSARPHAVVLDLAMPKMDGLWAIPYIKAAWPSTKVVVLSGQLDVGSAGAMALDRGADVALDKSTRAGTFTDAIAEIVGRS